ncbi:MAG: glycosyltransferase family 25 protein [Pseudomonadota bacterium]
MRLPVLVINRDQDTDRLAAFQQSAQRFSVEFERIPALDAHAPDFSFADYAGLIGDHFWGEAVAKPGAIGCFLSHRRAWQHVLDFNLPIALICEDDAEFLRDPTGLSALLGEASEFDVIFANRRLARWARAVSGEPAEQLSSVVAALAAKGGPKALGLKPTPGGDCYLVSARGASRLLALTAEQRITCGVDWAMIIQALPKITDEQAVAFLELAILRRTMSANAEPLTALVLCDPVADQSGQGGSTIKHAVKRPISEMRQ